jgi:oligosaccharide translocation protein RFT1
MKRRMSEELTRSTLRGATLLVSSQGFSRLLTFAGNVLLVRSMNNDAKPLGVSSTQFHLLYVAALSLTRDGVRRACLRELPANVQLSNPDGWEIAASLSRAYSLVGALVITPMVLYYFRSHAPEDIDLKEYMFSLWLVTAGSLLELLSEPMYVVAQNCSMFKLRSTVEALSSISRALVGLAASKLFGCRLSAFAWGYFATGLIIFLAYLLGMAKASNKGLSFSFRVLFGGSPNFAFSTNVGHVTWLTTKQSAWKMGLSEGEKIVMIAMGTVASDRGAYAMAANLGSLAARLVLQPCEEAAFTLFGKLKQNVEVEHLFSVLTRASVLFGLVFSCFGTQYTHLLVLLLYGRGWADNTETAYILSWYCVFISVCSINGITEAFLQAIANDRETESFNGWLLVCSVIFVFLSALLLPVMGTSGMVAANSCVMIIRIMRNLVFARSHITNNTSLRRFAPSVKTLTLFGISLGITWLSRIYLYRYAGSVPRAAMHVGIGFILLSCVALLVYVEDKDLILTLTGRSEFKQKTAAAELAVQSEKGCDTGSIEHKKTN